MKAKLFFIACIILAIMLDWRMAGGEENRPRISEEDMEIINHLDILEDMNIAKNLELVQDIEFLMEDDANENED